MIFRSQRRTFRLINTKMNMNIPGQDMAFMENHLHGQNLEF